MPVACVKHLKKLLTKNWKEGTSEFHILIREFIRYFTILNNATATILIEFTPGLFIFATLMSWNNKVIMISLLIFIRLKVLLSWSEISHL